MFISARCMLIQSQCRVNFMAVMLCGLQSRVPAARRMLPVWSAVPALVLVSQCVPHRISTGTDHAISPVHPNPYQTKSTIMGLDLELVTSTSSKITGAEIASTKK